MSQYRAILTLPILAAVALTAHRFVTPTGGVPAAGANTLGVTNADAASGEQAPIIYLGTAIVEASDAIAAGAAIETTGDGRAVTKSTGVAVARALQAATAAGQFIEVALIPN